MKITDFLFGLAISLFFRLSSWLCSVPMWLTLILHFVTGLPLYWFWATLAVWLLVGIIRYCPLGREFTRNTKRKQKPLFT